MSLLNKIFYGDFCPSDGIDYSDSYKKQMQDTFLVYQSFYKMLSDEQKEAFVNFMELDMDLSAISDGEHYIEGMRMGILLMLEVLGKP